MSNEELERIMVLNYTNVFREMLLSSLKANPKVTPDYLSQSIKRQREVEEQISRRSEEMARALVSRLKARGYLAKEPTRQALRSMIRQVLKEFEVKE